MEIKKIPVDQLKPAAYNPRKDLQPGDPEYEKIARSLDQWGYIDPIIWNKRTGNVVGGHQRLKILLARGETTVEASVVDLPENEEKALNVALNKLTGEWNKDALTTLLQELTQDMDIDESLTGFDTEEINALFADASQSAPKQLSGVADVIEPSETPIAEYGDIWICGQHRVMCGDSTRTTDCEMLMDGKRALMCFTDPPWNVAIGQDTSPKHRRRKGLVNDNLPPEQFEQFLSAFSHQVVKFVDGDLYCVLGASEQYVLDHHLRKAGFHWSATIIWVKDHFVLDRSKYHRRYEPIWYGWAKDRSSSFCNRRDLDDVWEIPRPVKSEEHPTMKPVALVTRAIENSSQSGDIVLDMFGGSGTTLIAAEQCGRCAYLMEIEPRYIDVIVKRYRHTTGKNDVRCIRQGEEIKFQI